MHLLQLTQKDLETHLEIYRETTRYMAKSPVYLTGCLMTIPSYLQTDKILGAFSEFEKHKIKDR